jgi:hypothetical protein
VNRAAQEDLVLAAVLDNPINAAILDVLSDDVLPGWYLTAGCVCQAVWNRLTGRPPSYGVADYDVFYFDASDLSYKAEDAVIRRTLALPGMPPGAVVEIRNQARVHLWYEQRFGVACLPLHSTEEGIDQFLTRSMAVGVRRERTGSMTVYARNGLDDLLALRIRPNIVAGRKHLYETKTSSLQARWPELSVEPWPEEATCRTT